MVSGKVLRAAMLDASAGSISQDGASQKQERTTKQPSGLIEKADSFFGIEILNHDAAQAHA